MGSHVTVFLICREDTMRSKADRKADRDAVEARFPRGSGKGDMLADSIYLGASYRDVNAPTSSIKPVKYHAVWANK